MRYQLTAIRINGNKVIHVSVDLVHLVQMARHWLTKGLWTSATIEEDT